MDGWKLYSRELVRPTSELILPVLFLLESIVHNKPTILTILYHSTAA
jgi:hypothetical protein